MRVTAVVGALLISAAAAAWLQPVAGQDVEWLGRHYGTRPPDAYFELIARDPNAFQLAHGRAMRMREQMRALARQTIDRTLNPELVLGPRNEVVKGTFHVPVILGLFSDSPAGTSGPYSRNDVATTYFGDGPGTIKDYYHEVSGGLVAVDGNVQDWVRSTMTQSQVAAGDAGLGSTTGQFILTLLQQLPASIDWGQFDNDGPDGIPNSGDDDGYVDALAVIQPSYGAECTGNSKDTQHIWSHKWNLASATGHSFTTTTPAANGGFIKIDDYLIQPVLACDNTTLNPIGTFTHEMGHAYFGLPDLYDVRNTPGNQGVGNWALMADGSWGCDGRSSQAPCHMGAWSLAELGWATVSTVPAGTDVGTLTVPPVETSHTVYQVNSEDGSGEYFLLENRQALGFDGRIPGSGLLVWDIDPTLVAQRWPQNVINASDHMAVRIRQADGRDDLGQKPPGGNRGDSGDPFPYVSGSTANRVFHAQSNPSSRSYGGTATGVTLVDIQKSGQDVTAHVSTRFTQVTVGTQGATNGTGLLTVDGAPVTTDPHTYTSAPFVPHEVDAAAGEPTGAGTRTAFIGWSDDASAPRQRSFVTPMTDASLMATYGGQQVQLAMDLTGGVDGVTPATFVTDPASPDLWFTPGVTVSIQAQARTGFKFLDWTGALAGQPNPATLTMNGPQQAGADFQLTYALSSQTVNVVAATQQETDLQVENGNAPVTWTVLSGTLPDGLTLNAQGQLLGAAMATGTFPLTVQAKDAIGLTAEAGLTVVVSDAVIPLDALASIFLTVGPLPSHDQNVYLDRMGNNNGVYDLGDLRAWVLSHPGLPMTAPAQALIAGSGAPRVIRFRTGWSPAGSAGSSGAATGGSAKSGGKGGRP